MFKTNNGGNSWHRNNSFPYFILAGPLSAIYNYSNKIYVGGYNSNIIISSDEGNTWHKANITNLTDTFNTYINKFLFINEVRGFAYTSKGYVLLTEDGGENWVVISSFSSVINNIYMLDSLHGYICSNNLFFTEDGGYNWKIVNYINTSSGYFDIKYLTYEKRFIVTSDSIYISLNAGSSWENIHNASGQIYNLGDSLIFIIGRESSVSNNGGNSWKKIEYLLNEGELTAATINNFQIIIAGSMGFIVKYSHPKLTYVEVEPNQDENIVNQISIYPNPTNNQANILFNIIRDSEITIGIYNILGREIYNLNLGLLDIGSYKISLNFNDLKQHIASGVYIVKLIDKQGFSKNYLSKKIIYLK